MARACVTELPGLAPYTADQCRTCENVPVAAPGEARRCGLEGTRPGFDGDGDGVADSADASARDGLENQLAILRRSDDARIEIAGHTDSQGTRDYNESLPLRRARAVRAFLVDHGIDSARLTIEGYGEAQPVADDSTAAERARNRRVELGVVGSGTATQQ